MIERKATEGVSFFLSALSAIAKLILDGAVPRMESLDTFRLLSKLLIEKLDITAMPYAPLPAKEPPAKSARYGHGTRQISASQVSDVTAVNFKALAGFLNDLIRTESDGIIMQFGFSILGQIRRVSPESLGCVWLPFLCSVLDLLEAHSIPLSTTRYQCIFGGILDAYLDKMVGKEPKTFVSSFSRPPIPCRRKTCLDCGELNRFLANEYQQETQLVSYTGHLEEQFKRLRDICSCTPVSDQPPRVWLITKAPTPSPQKQQWELDCHYAQGEIKREFDQGKLLTVLGEADFRRITTASHLRYVPDAPSWTPNIPSPSKPLAPVSGKQGVQRSVRPQHGAWPGPNTPAWGTPVQRQVAPGRPPPAPVAGVKRSAPPDDQVVDLTWMD